MTLRLRLIVRLAAVLALSLTLAAALACADAIRSVRTELVAALAGATQSAAGLVTELPPGGDPAAVLARAVATFDGSRHVRAVLLDSVGVECARSRLSQPADAPPAWFVWLVRPDLAPRRLVVGAITLVLSADPVNEVSEQLQTLQDEERAELARDLHDEIGPYLFAANLAATSIRESVERDGKAPLAAEVRNLQDVIGHMQREVRALLRRLRPTPAADLGLAEAIGSLAAFWSVRAPGPRISVELDLTGEPDAATAAALYRCVQEGMANALRHGRPAVVKVSVRAETGGFVACVTDDGTGAGGQPANGGLGLVGMRERMAALGGSVEAGPAAGRGWVLIARLPFRGAMA